MADPKKRWDQSSFDAGINRWFAMGVLAFLLAPLLVVIPLSFNAEPYFSFTEKTKINKIAIQNQGIDRPRIAKVRAL